VTWRRRLRKLFGPREVPPNDVCPVCAQPIISPVSTARMIELQPHPEQYITACRNRNGTSHTKAELYEALHRREREGPRSYKQEMADLEERLRRDE
jgi:hypothetical protein